MTRRGLILLFFALGFSALAAAFTPLPLAAAAAKSAARWYLAGALSLAVGACALGVLLARHPRVQQRAGRLCWLLAAVSPALGYLACKAGEYPVLACSVLLFSVFALAAFVRLERDVAFSAVAGLMLFGGCALALEAALRSLPAEVLLNEVRSTPPLVKADQVNIVYKKNWFRGKRPCIDCPPGNIRIMTLGGSSTYGVPMYYGSLSYTESLQRILDERRPGETYEVLNAGVAAYGITQVVAALREELLQYKPDVVSVCSWFNDSAPTNRWYQMPGISDKEAYERHRALKRLGEFPPYRKLRSTRLFGLSRWGLLGLKRALFERASGVKESSRPRMTPEEFRAGLEEVVRLGDEHGFLPVFILEALHRTDSLDYLRKSNDYYKQIFEVAAAAGLPVVDTVSRLHAAYERWVFHDFIHPNASGHRVIAEALYQDIFEQPVSARAREFLAQRGVDFSLPAVQLELRFDLPSEELTRNGFSFEARAPFLAAEQAELEVVINSTPPLRLNGLTNSFARFSLPADAFDARRPLTHLAVRAVVDRSQNPSWAVGATGVVSPVVIQAVSGGKECGWRVKVLVDGQRIDSDGRGYNVTLINADDGAVIEQKHFDSFASRSSAQALIDYLLGLKAAARDRKLITVVAVKTDGRHNMRITDLRRAFESIGGSGAVPQAFDSFLLIGSPGAPPGSAIEETGKRLIERIVGNPEQASARLLELRDHEPH